MTTLLIALLIAQVGIPGQYPGQSPTGYPPGQYPPNRFPGAGIPMPGKSKKTNDEKSSRAATQTTSGVVRTLEDKSIEIEAADTRLITFQITDDTARPKDLAVGYSVDIQGKDDGKGGFIADTIKVTKRTEAAGAAGTETENRPVPATLNGPKYDSDDGGPPVLKRGKPAQRAKRDTEEEDQKIAEATTPDSTVEARPSLSRANPAPPIVIEPHQALIDKARNEAGNFIEGLPNYVCQEFTTRYVSEGHVSDWHALDVVELELVYDGGKEDYRNIKVNGKPSKRPEDSGSWSTGEFGSILLDLFSPATAARFKYIKDATISNFPASLYDFTVERSHSHWHIQVQAQSVFPSYKGSIWVDKKTARVLRIEMQATNLPEQFPEDTVETAVDYNYISLGTPEKYFLPVHAETLGCERGANVCGRNVIEFRNYHKFTGESTIKFDK